MRLAKPKFQSVVTLVNREYFRWDRIIAIINASSIADVKTIILLINNWLQRYQRHKLILLETEINRLYLKKRTYRKELAALISSALSLTKGHLLERAQSESIKDFKELTKTNAVSLFMSIDFRYSVGSFNMNRSELLLFAVMRLWNR